MYLLNHIFTPYSGHLLKMHVSTKSTVLICASVVFMDPRYFPLPICGVNNLIHPVISNSWGARGLLKNGNSSCYCADAWGLLPGHFVKGRDSSLACLPPGIPTGPENLESLESRGRYFDGWGGFLQRTEAIVPCWALSPGGGGSQGPGWPEAEGAENRSRDRRALNCVPSAGRTPSSAPRERVRCVPGSVSISAARGVGEPFASPSAPRGRVPGAARLLWPHLSAPNPTCPRLSPSASPRSGSPGPAAPRSPGLAAPLPFLPPARVPLFTSQAPSGTRSLSPFYLGFDFPLELWVGKLLILIFNASSVLYTAHVYFLWCFVLLLFCCFLH